MRSLILVFTFLTPTCFTQIQNECFQSFNEFGVGTHITFTDSTFKFTSIQGLSTETTKGTYHISNDTITLSSYPHSMNDINTIFFQEQKVLVKNDYIIFLTENNKREKDFFTIRKRKRLTISKRKKVKKYKMCT